MGERRGNRSVAGRSSVFVTVVALSGLPAGGAFADSPIAATSASQSANSVISYPASFFASMGLDTAYDMVQRVPGFVFDDGNAVRGFVDSVGNVLIDGRRPVSKTDDVASILQRIPVSSIERVDYIRGGAPGIDMLGKTSVVNVIRKKNQGFKGVAVVGADKALSGIPYDPQLQLQGSSDDGGRTLEGSILLARFHGPFQGSGPHDILGPSGDLLDSSSMHNRAVYWQYVGTAAYEAPVLGGSLRLNLTLDDQPYDKTNIDNFQIAGPEYEFYRQDVDDAELGQHYERNFSGPWKLELIGLEHLNATNTDSLFDTETDHEIFDQRNHGGELIGRAVMHWRPSDLLTIDAGGEFADNWIQTDTLYTDNGAIVDVPAGDVLVAEKRGEAFTTAVLRPLETLAIEAGVRVEESTISSSGDVTLSNTLEFPKPRLVVTWTPDTEDQLRLRVEREVGQIDFSNFAASAALNANGVTAGNPDLLPQQDWAVEAAYDCHFWTDGVVSLTARHLFLEDVLDTVPVYAPSGAFNEPGNIGNGSENDIIASVNFPLDRLWLDHATLRGVGTWRFSDVTDPTTGQQREISGQQPLTAEIHFSQDLTRWNLTWGLDSAVGALTSNFLINEIDDTYIGTENTLYLEYRPDPTITFRFQTDLEKISEDLTRQVYSGLRGSSSPEFEDVQQRRYGPITFFSVRKTFD